MRPAPGQRVALALVCWLLLATAALGSEVDDDGYQWVTAVIDVRSTVSDGSHDLETLASLAHERGIGALLLSDHEQLALEYGLFPFRQWLRYREERPSVTTYGLDRYLAAIDRAGQPYHDLLLLPGVEATPFYYWSGVPFRPLGLTAHEWERHLLVFGLEGEAWAGLPTVGHRSGLAFSGQPPVLALFGVVLLLGGVILSWGGRVGRVGLALMVLALAGGVDALRWGPSRFDQYHGNQGSAPYQDFIDYVTDHHGLVFWNHPGTRSGSRPLPPIRLDTPPYPEVLSESVNYTGVAVLSGETFSEAEPGALWDQTLEAYALGQRQRPAWGIASADFHRDGKNGEALGDYGTVAAVRAFTGRELLAALAKGRCYAVRGPHASQDRLLTFRLTDPATGSGAIMGERLATRGQEVEVVIALEAKNGESHALNLRLIRNGVVIHTATGHTPFRLTVDDQAPLQRLSYYRLEVKSDCCRILSNPIFVAAGTGQ